MNIEPRIIVVLINKETVDVFDRRNLVSYGRPREFDRGFTEVGWVLLRSGQLRSRKRPGSTDEPFIQIGGGMLSKVRTTVMIKHFCI